MLAYEVLWYSQEGNFTGNTHINHWNMIWNYIMVTSSNGNIFCVIGTLWGESNGHGGFPSQRPVTRSFDVFFDLRLSKQRRRHRVHYEVTVMTFKVTTIPPMGQWKLTPVMRTLWRHCNDIQGHYHTSHGTMKTGSGHPRQKTWVRLVRHKYGVSHCLQMSR